MSWQWQLFFAQSTYGHFVPVKVKNILKMSFLVDLKIVVYLKKLTFVATKVLQVVEGEKDETIFNKKNMQK